MWPSLLVSHSGASALHRMRSGFTAHWGGGGSSLFGQRWSPLCLITCLQFGDLNPSCDWEGPPLRFIFVLIGNILCPSLSLALINRKPPRQFLQNEINAPNARPNQVLSGRWRWESSHLHLCSCQFRCRCHQGACNCFLPFYRTPLRAAITWRPLRAVIL